MCIFTGEVEYVAGTQIYARHVGDRQVLIYSMRYGLADDVAMVLPIPGDDVRFVDLSEYPTLFDDLGALFPVMHDLDLGASAGASESVLLSLPVHRVGSFVASYVPSVADFARLDRRFRLRDGVLPAAYADYGFAVFQLAKTAHDVHPIALTFRTRDRSAVFFPTLHVHDGAHVPDYANFDHALYCETGAPNWHRGFRFEHTERTRGLVAPVVQRLIVEGTLANADTWVHPDRRTVFRAPPGPDDRRRGERYELFGSVEATDRFVGRLGWTANNANVLPIDTPARAIHINDRGKILDEDHVYVTPGESGPFSFTFALTDPYELGPSVSGRVVFATCPPFDELVAL